MNGEAMANSHAKVKPITAHWLTRCIDEIIDDNTIHREPDHFSRHDCLSPAASG